MSLRNTNRFPTKPEPDAGAAPRICASGCRAGTFGASLLAGISLPGIALAADAYIPVGVAVPPPVYAPPVQQPAPQGYQNYYPPQPGYAQGQNAHVSQNFQEAPAAEEPGMEFYVRGSASWGFFAQSMPLLTPERANGAKSVEVEDAATIGLGGIGMTGGFGVDLGMFRGDITYSFSKVEFDSGEDVKNVSIDLPLKADVTHHIGMVNLFVDIPASDMITPFIGVGAGGTYSMLSDFSNESETYPGENAFGFAAAGHAGAAFLVSDNFWIEAGYRGLLLPEILGKKEGAETEAGTEITLDKAAGVGLGFIHEVQLGIRFHF